MAKIKFGALAADARGKIDGVVYSKNQFGSYIRQKVSPVQPNSERQTLVRERQTTLSKRFSTVITEAQREAWRGFATVNPVPDVFGNPQALTGIAAYIRLNQVILNGGGTIINTPPADLEVPGLFSMSVTASTGPDLVEIAFTPTPLPAGMRLYIFGTQGMNAGVNFFRPLMRFLGVSGPAAVSPFDATSMYTAKFGSLIVDKAIGLTVSVVDITKGAVSPGIFAKAIVT
jgi:hypothetical protein